MGYGFGFGFSLMDFLFPIMFFSVFIMFMIVFVGSIVKSLRQKRQNDQSPILTVDVIIIDKYTDVHSHRHDNHRHYNTTFYVTFEVESGDRLVLEVNEQDYGYLIVNDKGKLTFQGTRYLGFERVI